MTFFTVHQHLANSSESYQFMSLRQARAWFQHLTRNSAAIERVTKKVTLIDSDDVTLYTWEQPEGVTLPQAETKAAGSWV